MLKRAWVRVLLIFAGWTLLAVFYAGRMVLSYAYSGYEVNWAFPLQLSLTQWYGWAVLFPVIVLVARRFSFGGRLWWRDALVHLPVAVVFAFGKAIADQTLLPLVTGVNVRYRQIDEAHSNLLTYGVLVGLVLGIDYYRKYRDRELRTAQLETRLAEARLEALRMQLHPHFLFNTLNGISALMHRDVEAADRMLARLSELLRLTLEAGDEQEIPLRQELEFLDRYLAIEKVRFGERLTVLTEVQPDALDAMVPNLILQPLVENAIRHGIGPHARPGRIELRAERRNGRLRLEVTDNGRGIPVGDGGPVVEGVGLSNTRARLRQLYGDDQSFALQNGSEAGLTVRIEIPYRAIEFHPREEGDD